ncbi:hypothetical protein EXN66_Car019132 [Channa argus]|uniref:Uncharacterized protein n=1 Tax=Channa argus TaxID=215402 RepID=A0A6G1QLU4_CHAAH|nr:hypothetical protein EXN66_Car019132 [Channa argus]
MLLTEPRSTRRSGAGGFIRCESEGFFSSLGFVGWVGFQVFTGQASSVLSAITRLPKHSQEKEILSEGR